MATNRDDFTIAIRSALLQKGAKQRYSLFFFICISILVFFLDSFQSKTMTSAKSLLNDGVYRISSVATSPFKFVVFIGNLSKKHFLTYNENKILKAELAKFRAKDFQNDFLKSQNRNLQEILKSSIAGDEEGVMAKVLLDKESPFLKSIIVNKGSKSKIKKGMPVVSSTYLVGRVVEVNYLSSRVLLLNDLNSRIPVEFGDRAVQSIMTGEGTSKPRLKFLPENFEALEGETIFTSGKDGVLKPGIPIGRIELFKNEPSVKLFSDPNQLSVVNIILSNFIQKNKL
jgi:rod shape-determining protein MreC